MSARAPRAASGAMMLQGAIAGALATVAMSAAMFGLKKVGLMGEMPPERITSRMLDRLGVRRSREAQDVAASVSHVAFGAAGGAGFGALRTWLPLSIPTLPLAVLFATAIW